HVAAECVRLMCGGLLPVWADVSSVCDDGVPIRLRGGRAVLDAVAVQAHDGGALRAVDLELYQLVAVHAHVPAGVQLHHGAALETEDAVEIGRASCRDRGENEVVAEDGYS